MVLQDAGDHVGFLVPIQLTETGRCRNKIDADRIDQAVVVVAMNFLDAMTNFNCGGCVDFRSLSLSTGAISFA
jgi:hypothetical protein